MPPPASQQQELPGWARTIFAKIYCGKLKPVRSENIMESTKGASKILAIDGCSSDCARNTLLQAGFKEFAHLRLTDIGMEKGKSPVSEEKIEIVLKESGKILGH